MTIDKAYYVGIHRYSYRAGTPAEIIGVECITSDQIDPKEATLSKVTKLC
jgi:hypothetical protein